MEKSNEKYLLLKMAGQKPYIVVATVSPVKKKTHKEYGKCSISTDLNYNPLIEHSKYSDYLSLKSCKEILKDLGFIKVKLSFDKDSISDLKSIKSKIPKNWIENFNLLRYSD